MLDQLGIADAVFFGTSLGGLCTMLLASTDADRIAGAMLNDIGPEIDQAGIDRIGGYVGQDDAVRRLGRGDRRARATATRRYFPSGARANGSASCAASAARTKDGIRFDYDMAIADNFRARDRRPAGRRAGISIGRSTGAR